MSLLDWRTQFAHPRGTLGAVAGHLMAVKNRDRSRWVLSLLELRPGERVLEVGFGPGVDVARAAAQVGSGWVAGVDLSEVMLRQATRRNARAIAGGRVDLRLSDASTLPFEDSTFDKAYAINVAQFWGGAAGTLAELRRVVKKGGLVALAVQPRSKGATEETARQTGRNLAAALRDAGFGSVRVESRAMRPVSTVCALGVR